MQQNNSMAVKNIADPCYYDLLIADRKRRVRAHPDDAGEWLEFGRIHEAKIDFTNSLAKRNFFVRYFPLLYSLIISVAIVLLILGISILPSLSSPRIVVMSILTSFLLIFFRYLWSLRYPSSGRKYFKKAIALDPDCGEAYLHLGLIALRRHQKGKACRLLEQAIGLKIDNRKIERELKSIYEKEFMAFFNKETEREVKQKEIIDRQSEQIKDLRSRLCSLERLNESLSGRANQTRWESNHKRKLLTREMTDRIGAIRGEYEKQIAAMSRSMETRDEAVEMAERNLVKLTTEIIEAKSALESRSLAEAAMSMEDIMDSRLWKALSDQTRSYLATAEHIFNLLTANEEDPDYSLVGMELCKAIETEINRTLVEPFVLHLNGNREEFLKVNQTGVTKGKPFYFTYLAKVVDGTNFPGITSLTLGQYHFVLKRSLEGEYAMKEYCNFINELSLHSGTVIGKMFLKDLEIVTKRYRNSIVHQSFMSKKEYGHLRELVFAGEEALLKTCGRIALGKGML